MKNLINDNSAVAYLLLVGLGLSLVVIGIAYAFISDMTDALINGINLGYSGTPMETSMDAESIEGGFFLLTLFRMILIPAFLVLIYWIWTMAQKPVRPY